MPVVTVPRCYAAALGDCGGGLSREHYISHGLLRSFGSLNVQGLRWLQGEGPISMQPKRLVSKVLCEAHNQMLSPLDDVAKELFVDSRTRMDSMFVPDSERRRGYQPQTLIAGHDFERLLLKWLCAILAGNVVETKASVGPGWQPPREWLEILFRGAPWPEGCGLWADRVAAEFTAKSGHLRVSILSDHTSDVLGISFEFNWMVGWLAMTDPRSWPDWQDHEAVYRPRSFVIEDELVTERIFLGWKEPKGSGDVVGRVNSLNSGNPSDNAALFHPPVSPLPSWLE